MIDEHVFNNCKNVEQTRFSRRVDLWSKTIYGFAFKAMEKFCCTLRIYRVYTFSECLVFANFRVPVFFGGGHGFVSHTF
ncbi:hypothetical protein D3C81_1117990 [compost metagenome]